MIDYVILEARRPPDDRVILTKRLARHQQLSVGRTDVSDLVVADDPEMSGRHFHLAIDDDQCVITDQNSRNHTWLNGQEISRSEINDGDQIRAGRTTFTVHIVELNPVSMFGGGGGAVRPPRPEVPRHTGPRTRPAEPDTFLPDAWSAPEPEAPPPSPRPAAAPSPPPVRQAPAKPPAEVPVSSVAPPIPAPPVAPPPKRPAPPPGPPPATAAVPPRRAVESDFIDWAEFAEESSASSRSGPISQPVELHPGQADDEAAPVWVFPDEDPAPPASGSGATPFIPTPPDEIPEAAPFVSPPPFERPKAVVDSSPGETTQILSEAESSAPDRVRITVPGDDSIKPRVLETAGTRIVVGRDERADWVFAGDLNMSGRHFEIELSDSQCAVRDLRSTNGTFLNGQRVLAAPLKSGDQIRAGQTFFAVEFF
jgi:pSer/pThr/pTyr-binding forkhead associated (FHA) protein